MNRSPYSAYRGRKSVLQRVLIAIVILLVIALALATVALFVLPRYVVDTPNGPQLVLPLFGSGNSSATPGPVQTAQVSVEPTALATDGNVVVEPPSATPSPTPTPIPADDLLSYVRRDIPLGLALTQPDALDAGGSNGILVDMTDFDLDKAGSDLSKGLAAVTPYSAAWLPADRVDTELCVTLASLGFDELVLAENVPTDGGSRLAKSYTDIKKTLDDAGWQGRLGLVLNQDLFDAKYDDGLIPAIAQSFDRLYFRTTLKSANKNALTSNGFTANGYTLVTVVQNVANLNYAWAILP